MEGDNRAWGCVGAGNIEILKKEQLKFYKQVKGLKKLTPSNIYYGNLVTTPLHTEIRRSLFWTKHFENAETNKLSSIDYNMIIKMHNAGKFKPQ